MERVASIATIISAICSVAGLALQLAPVLGAPLTGFAGTMAESSAVWLPVATFVLGLSIGAWATARKGAERIAEKDAEIARLNEGIGAKDSEERAMDGYIDGITKDVARAALKCMESNEKLPFSCEEEEDAVLGDGGRMFETTWNGVLIDSDRFWLKPEWAAFLRKKRNLEKLRRIAGSN